MRNTRVNRHLLQEARIGCLPRWMKRGTDEQSKEGNNADQSQNTKKMTRYKVEVRSVSDLNDEKDGLIEVCLMECEVGLDQDEVIIEEYLDSELILEGTTYESNDIDISVNDWIDEELFSQVEDAKAFYDMQIGVHLELTRPLEI